MLKMRGRGETDAIWKTKGRNYLPQIYADERRADKKLETGEEVSSDSRNLRKFAADVLGWNQPGDRQARPSYLKLFNASASSSNESNTVRSLVMTRRF